VLPTTETAQDIVTRQQRSIASLAAQ